MGGSDDDDDEDEDEYDDDVNRYAFEDDIAVADESPLVPNTLSHGVIRSVRVAAHRTTSRSMALTQNGAHQE